MPNTPVTRLYQLDEPLDRGQLLAEFSDMPALLSEAVRGVEPARLVERPEPGEWSPFDVICHVRDIAAVYALRFRWIVLNDNPVLPDYDENRWVADSRNTTADLSRILGHIAASRADICDLLGRLSEGEWRRTGRHEVMGTVVLDEYLAHEVAHERQHIDQIRAALRD